MNRKVLLILVLLAVPLVGRAEPPLPLVPEELQWFEPVYCIDSYSKYVGECQVAEDVDGNRYIVFWKEHKMMFIRKFLLDGSFIDVWLSDNYSRV